MVRIAVVDRLAVDLAAFENLLRLVVETVALPRFRREHGDIFQNPHRRDAVDDDLTALATR